MQRNLPEDVVRDGEELAFKLFRRVVAKRSPVWISKAEVWRYRGLGWMLARGIYEIARNIEESKLSPALRGRRVDRVSPSSIRAALRAVGNGLVQLRKARVDPQSATPVAKSLAEFTRDAYVFERISRQPAPAESMYCVHCGKLRRRRPCCSLPLSRPSSVP